MEYISETPNISLIDNNVINYNIIVLRNAQSIPEEVVYSIKKISERRYMNCRFLLITNSLVNINKLLANFMLFRVPVENTENILSYIKYILDNENIKYNNDSVLTKIIKDNNYSLSKIISTLEASFVSGTYKKYHNEYEFIINKIIKTIEDKKSTDFNKIREYV